MFKRFLVVNNISKKNNIFALCVTAAAHSFSVLFSTPGLLNDITLELLRVKGLTWMTFESFECVKNFLKDRSIDLVGIEIMENSIPFQLFPYTSEIAFLPGNEGTGLNGKQKNLCDKFIYIPQFGAGTASLNVNVATGIILNEYCATVRRLHNSL